MKDLVLSTLRNRFSLTSLYPFQELVVRTILEKEEQGRHNNLLVILPTGAGKSICFMLPSLIINGITMIVYPLLSLLNDQKRRIEALGENAVVLRGGQSTEERESLFFTLSSGSASFLLLTCEILEIESVRKRIALLPVSLAVVDEAHVIAQWGLTFRPAYLHLGSHIAKIAPHQVLAFTATLDRANASVIRTYLFQGQNYHTIRGSSDRENIQYRVMRTLSKDLSLRLLLVLPSLRPAIVFFRSRRKTELVAERLREHLEGIEVSSYHAGMEREERERVEKWFYESSSGVLCATSAYGMGVDKNNVRSVIHYDVPVDALAFLQESGRGGRDGNGTCSCTLLSPVDLRGRDNPVLSSFTSISTCRRQRLLDLISSPAVECSGCDVCDNNPEITFLGTDPILSTVNRYPGRFDIYSLRDYLEGRRDTIHPFGRYKGIFSLWEPEEIKQAVQLLVDTGRIRESKRRHLYPSPLFRVAERIGSEYVHHMISEQDTIAEILTRYPFIKEALVEHNSVFRNLNNPLMLKTVARFAKLKDAAKNSGEDIASLMAFINREIEKHQAES